jgi:glycosyltransferase involved in cell wall biosynthesis
MTNPGVSGPLVTIGIASYNAADTLERAVLSASRQDWPNREIIVVDDASTDRSVEVLDKLVRHDPRIRVIRHASNKGLAGVHNTIVREARGDFIALFDDDDESAPERLRSQWDRIVSYEGMRQCQLVLCYSNRNVIKRGGDYPDHIAFAIGRREPEPHGAIVADYLFGRRSDPNFVWGLFGSCTLMARRETFLAVGPFDETFRRCAEWDMAVRAAFMGAHFIAVDKPLVTTYKTLGADKAGTIPLRAALQLREKHRTYLKERGSYWASRAIAHYHYYGNQGRSLHSWVYLAAACIASPVFLLHRLDSRLRRNAHRRCD